MAQNKQLTERVRQKLARMRGVEEKIMFRGTTFMINGKMCLSTGDNELLCRFDSKQHETLSKMAGCRPMIMKGREYKGYVYVNEQILDNEDRFDFWIKLAVSYNLTLTEDV